MIAFIFPGQGSQAPGMARDLYDGSPAARELLDELAEAAGFPLLRLMFEGPADELTQTQNAQPALLAHSAAATLLLAQAGLAPGVVAGHSLGEYSALVAAGSLTAATAVTLVRSRGQHMAEAAEQVGGTMAAVIGLGAADLEQAIASAREDGVVVAANLNALGQIVISGEVAAVRHASELATAAGAKRVLPLSVSGAFHSPLMAPAAQALAEALAATPFADAAVPVVSNVDAVPRTDADGIRGALTAQMTGAVRWEECVARMLDLGVTTFVEVGPGKVLANMLRRSVPGATVYSADTLDSVTATIAALS